MLNLSFAFSLPNYIIVHYAYESRTLNLNRSLILLFINGFYVILRIRAYYAEN